MIALTNGLIKMKNSQIGRFVQMQTDNSILAILDTTTGEVSIAKAPKSLRISGLDMAKMKYTFLRNGVYYAQYTNPLTGKRIRKSLGKDKVKAKAKIDALISAYSLGSD